MAGHWKYWGWLVSTLLLVDALGAEIIQYQNGIPEQIGREPWQFATLNHKSDASEQVNAQFSPAVPLTYENLKLEEYQSQILGSHIQPPSEPVHQLSPPAAPAHGSGELHEAWSIHQSPVNPGLTIPVWGVQQSPPVVPKHPVQPWSVQPIPAVPGVENQPWGAQQSPPAPEWNAQQSPPAHENPIKPLVLQHSFPSHHVGPHSAPAVSQPSIGHHSLVGLTPAGTQLAPSVAYPVYNPAADVGASPAAHIHIPVPSDISAAPAPKGPSDSVSVHYQQESADGQSFGYSYSFPINQGKNAEGIPANNHGIFYADSPVAMSGKMGPAMNEAGRSYHPMKYKPSSYPVPTGPHGVAHAGSEASPAVDHSHHSNQLNVHV